MVVSCPRSCKARPRPLHPDPRRSARLPWPWSSGEEKSGLTRIADSNLDKRAQKSKTKRKGKGKVKEAESIAM